MVINPNDTQTITVYNDPVGGLELIKVNADDTKDVYKRQTSTWTSWAGSMRHSTPAGSQGAAMWYIRERG